MLLSRDLHGLALLFLMPLAFVVIMSLALQNQFSERSGTRLKVLVLDADQSTASRAMLGTLGADNAFEFVIPKQVPDDITLDEQLRHGEYAFAITVVDGFSTAMTTDSTAADPLMRIRVAPDSSVRTETHSSPRYARRWGENVCAHC